MEGGKWTIIGLGLKKTNLCEYMSEAKLYADEIKKEKARAQ